MLTAIGRWVAVCHRCAGVISAVSEYMLGTCAGCTSLEGVMSTARQPVLIPLQGGSKGCGLYGVQ
eukprot:7391781-Prymnesium_polylepis.3